MKEPLLDIVMLVHDQAGWADLAVRAVEAFTRNPYRLIVVDSGSQEGATKVWLKEVEDRGHIVVRLAANRSFSAGVNAGVHVGSARFIVFLNDDAIVTEGWDTALLQDAADKHVGLVGAKSNYAAGVQGGQLSLGEPPFIVFVCAAMRREIWDVVGPLDGDTFDGFSSEDLDYSWRVQKAGYKLKVSNAFVLHGGSRTLSAKVGDLEARARNDAKYMARLNEKWGKEHVAAKTKVLGKILVNTYSAEEWTRVAFMGAIAGLRVGAGVGFTYHHMTRAPIHMARQLICDYALDNGFDWLVQLDDDATFPPDLLIRLLAHQKDVVCALAYQRKPPHATCCFEVAPDGLLGSSLEGIEHTGLRKVDVSGFHCSLIHTSVIKRLRDAGIRQYWGGFDNKVGEDFAFPVAPETPVLGEDWRWRPIIDYRPGMAVIGFDEHSPAHSSRRFTPAIVTDLIKKVLPRVRVITDEEEIVTTAEHPWLSNSGVSWRSKRWAWRPAGGLKPGMVVASVTPFEANPDVESLDYAAGYIQGIFHSDGYRSVPNRADGRRYVSFAVKMKDTAPLERLATALALHGIESTRSPVRWDGIDRHAPLHGLGVHRQEAARRLDQIYEIRELPSAGFAAGYLAGKYDGDGNHFGGGLFISSQVDWKKDRLEEAGRIVGVPFTARDPRHVRITGQENIFRFWQRVSPALTRRMSLGGQLGNDGIQRGKEVKHRPVLIRAVEPMPAAEVFCLTTTSSTFVARGLASHNCLNLRKIGVSIYVDTELISGHIGSSIVVDEAYKRDYMQSLAAKRG